MKDLCLVINTCKQYFTNIHDLTSQIINSSFNKSNVLIVSGQENENSISFHENIKIVKVTYSGIHLTSAIYIQENIQEYSDIKYWVLLPDTIKFGDNFFIRLNFYYETYLKNKDVLSLPFINPRFRPSMDMGIVHTTHLLKMADYLQGVKTYQCNIGNLLLLKKRLIYDENTILGLPSVSFLQKKLNFINFPPMPDFFISNSPNDILEEFNEAEKIHEVYFKNLDLHKFQRNFRGPNAELIINI